MGRRAKKAPRKKAVSRLTKPTELKDGHTLDVFSCGRPQMDRWLQENARTARDRRTARTYVVCRGTRRVVGYFALSAGSVEHEDAPGSLRRNTPNPIPVIILARLAVDGAEQGNGLGASLLREAMLRALQASDIIGARALLVHALDDKAARYYEGHGFRRMRAGSETLYLPMHDIAGNL